MKFNNIVKKQRGFICVSLTLHKEVEEEGVEEYWGRALFRIDLKRARFFRGNTVLLQSSVERLDFSTQFTLLNTQLVIIYKQRTKGIPC